MNRIQQEALLRHTFTIHSTFKGVRERMEYLISVTPTSTMRNKLTEANMILMDAERQFKELVKASEQA